ncbi:MAG TPA: DUF5719 family protein [Acidimicrobiales bacterium]
MSSLRRVPLFVALALVLIATGVFASMAKSTNQSQLPGGLALTSTAESTALYCTGLTSAKDGASGHVTFVNTTQSAHLVIINAVSDAGARYSRQALLGAHQSISIDPSARLQGNSFGVGALISGGGVVGIEVTKNDTGEAPCISTGVANWYGSGFNTTVGSSAELSVYNPTATPAVFNVVAYSAAGLATPAKFQGLSLGAHGQVELNLGTQIVNTTNVGVHVHVLRGSLVIVGVQQSGSTVSLNSGSSSPTTSAVFPQVTTEQGATAQIRFSNPGPRPAQVTLGVKLTTFHIANQSVTVPAYGTELTTITPNPAIPAAGYATVQLRSSEPVVASLATGSGSDIALSAPELPESEYLVGDFTGLGFDAAALTNTSSRSITVSFVTFGVSATKGARGSASVTYGAARLSGNSTSELRTDFPGLPSFRHAFFVVSASRPTLLVTLTSPTRPAGTTLLAVLDGR